MAIREPGPAIQAERPWLAHYESHVPAEVDVPAITVDGLLRRSADRFPARDALVFYGARTTYARLDDAVDRFAGYLRTVGLVPGDRVSLHLPTTPAFVIAFLGILRAGCVAVPMSPLLVERELEVLLRETRPRVSVTFDLLVPRLSEARSALGALLAPPARLSGIIATGLQDSLPRPLNWLYPLRARREGRWRPVAHTPAMPNLFRLLADLPSGRFESAASASDTAVLQPTGGTTGIPKAAVITHRNLVANAVQCSAVLPGDDTEASSILCALPYFHIYGLTVAMDFALQRGLTQLLVPRFDPITVLKAIHHHRPRLFPGAPAFYAQLLEQKDLARYDVSSVEACISGSAPLPVAIQERFEALSGGRVCEGYGLTEASPVTHVNPIHGVRKPGTVGLPFPSTDARVMDVETGTEALPPGTIGELWVRGPQVMSGYWERPEETASVLRDGWLRTGDLATMDEEGYFAIVDRIKDLIIVSGANVYPREVDEVLLQHPAVAEAATIGTPDPIKGEVPRSYVVLRPGAVASASDLRIYCLANLSRYKCPTAIEIRTELPKTGIGKVLRRTLRDEHAAAAPEEADAPTTEADEGSTGAASTEADAGSAGTDAGSA